MVIEFFSIQVHFSMHIASNFEWTVQIGEDTGKQYELFFVCFFLHQVMNFVAIPMSLMYYLDFNHSATQLYTRLLPALLCNTKQHVCGVNGGNTDGFTRK